MHLLSLEEFDADSYTQLLGSARLVLLLSSTYGAGACPSTANRFMAWLKARNTGAADALAGMYAQWMVRLWHSSLDTRVGGFALVLYSQKARLVEAACKTADT